MSRRILKFINYIYVIFSCSARPVPGPHRQRGGGTRWTMAHSSKRCPKNRRHRETGSHHSSTNEGSKESVEEGLYLIESPQAISNSMNFSLFRICGPGEVITYFILCYYFADHRASITVFCVSMMSEKTLLFQF